MKSYLCRRLLPFVVFALCAELLFKTFLIMYDEAKFDLSAAELAKSGGIMLLTTLISALYMLIPYVLFLLFLPRNKQNSPLDRRVSTAIYFLFVFGLLFEKTAAFIFWDEFSAAFNFIAVDYLVYTHEVIDNIYQSYPVNIILAVLFAAAGLIVFLTRSLLFARGQAPGFWQRLTQAAVFALLLAASYWGADMPRLEINKNYYNTEMSKNGTYSLFSAFLKNELDYKIFYPTKDPAENLRLLREKFKGRNVEFLNPERDLSRRITSFRSENKANVIIVLMESMSAKFMIENRAPGLPELTPNLSRLAKEGLYFANTYASGTRSVRGIEAVTLSAPPLPGLSIVRRPNNGGLHNAGSIFRDKGYDNKWIYGGYGYFDNMNNFFENNGFQIVDREEWEDGEVTFANAWGASDDDTFNKVIKEADKSFEQGKPFMTVLLTISNHRPYTFPENRAKIPEGIGGRERGVFFADYAIGRFLEDAKWKPWFDNTLFVFVADHTAGAAGKEEINLEGHRIPWIIYAPKIVKAQRFDKPVSQLDVLPTILGLLNFNYESRFYGQDALADTYESRFFVSNYQRMGYVKNGVDVILKPVRQFSVEPKNADKKIVEENLREGIAFYQQASDWRANFKKVVAQGAKSVR